MSLVKCTSVVLLRTSFYSAGKYGTVAAVFSDAKGGEVALQHNKTQSMTLHRMLIGALCILCSATVLSAYVTLSPLCSPRGTSLVVYSSFSS